jgi:hypothetical protein
VLADFAEDEVSIYAIQEEVPIKIIAESEESEGSCSECPALRHSIWEHKRWEGKEKSSRV